MPSLKHWRLALALLPWLLVNSPLVSCSPLQGHIAQPNSPPFRQVTAPPSSDSKHTTQPSKGQYTLPPVSAVFKIVADADPSAPKAFVPQSLTALRTSSISPSNPASSFMTTLASTTADTSNPKPTHVGPGLVIPLTSSPTSEATSTPTPISATPAGSAADGTSHKISSAGKLIAIAVVLVGLIVLIFLVFVLDYRCICCGARKKDKSEAWTKLASPPPGSDTDSEKPTMAVVPGRLLFSALSSSLGQRAKKNDATSKALIEKADPESRVIDISSENKYPRSKFSVSSSEYPTSLESFARTSSSGCRHDNSPLLPAYEFCCIPSSVDSHEDHHHTRTRSAPIFGHAISAERFGVMVRPGEHRRSRSISGLTYAISPREYRHSDSGSSANTEWKESPPDFSGGLSSAM